MEALMNRIPKAVYTKEFREEAVKVLSVAEQFYDLAK
jgi:hypothetical protein